jgi:hypothetical protein
MGGLRGRRLRAAIADDGRALRRHLAEFLAAVNAQTDGSGLPGFVVGEFRKFLRCGVLAHGFARVQCGDCAFERLVPFLMQSARGLSELRGTAHGGARGAPRRSRAAGRRAGPAVGALGPPPLGYRLAYDHRLCRTVLYVFVRALRSAYRREARRQGPTGGETGMVTSVQRFGGP